MLYESGKLVIQGKGTGEFVEFTLEPLILKRLKMGLLEKILLQILVKMLFMDQILQKVLNVKFLISLQSPEDLLKRK